MIGSLRLPGRFTARRAHANARAAGRPAQARDAFHLTRRFLLLSLAAIAAVSMASSIVLSRFIVREGLGRDARVAAQFIEKSVLQRHAASYFGAPHEPTAERAEVERFLVDLLWMPDVLRAQVHSVRGEVLWSSHAPSVHQTFEGNPELERALRGELVIEADFLKWWAQSKPEHLFAAKAKPQFTEYYVPVWSADRARVIGVVELYKSPQSLFQSIHDGIRLVWLCDFAGGMLIFLSLVWVVRRGQRIIERQQRRLASNEGFVAVGEVASAVAHNLRNPLGAIRTSAELMAIDVKGGRPGADLCRYAEDIVADVDRLEAWIRSLLSYAHAGARETASVALDSLAGRLSRAIGAEAAHRGVDLMTRFDAPDARVCVDPLLLEQVVRTLADNAIDAMSDGGRLEVSTRLEGRHVLLVIKDSGIGMPPEQVERLFRDPASTKSRGLGIGLPLVARTVERIGGRIRVESERGRGTCVELSLPLAAGGGGA